MNCFTSNIVTFSDYYPFGMLMLGRNGEFTPSVFEWSDNGDGTVSPSYTAPEWKK